MVTRHWLGERSIVLHIDRFPAMLMQLGALVAASLRGLDYIALPHSAEVTNLGVIESALPFDVWGWLYLIAGSLGLAGMLLPRIPITGAAHGMLVALYFTFGIGTLADIVAQGIWHGWRTGVGWILMAAVVHAVLFDSSMDAWRRASVAK